MNCDRSKDLLQLYLDGVLALTEAQELEAHVAGCAVCRGDLVRMERLFIAMEALPRVPAPVQLLPRTMAAIASRSPWTFDNSPLHWGMNTAALIAMLAGLVLAAVSAEEAADALAALMVAQENPVALVDGLLAVAASLQFSLVAGIALLLGAGCLTLVQLVADPSSSFPLPQGEGRVRVP